VSAATDRRGWAVQTHGYGGYTRGCRCETCKSDRAAYLRNRRAAAAARRIAAEAAGQVYVADGIRHGTTSGYKNASCRCPECCQAAMARRRGVYESPVANKPAAAEEPAAAPVACIRCKGVNSAGLCCSSHNAALCHRCYRLTHFVGRCVEGCGECAREGLDPMQWPAPAAKVGA